jgi:hypothetical protein
VLAVLPLAVSAQQTPKLVVDEDCQAFAVAPNGTTIAFAVPRVKHMKRLYVERDDIAISENGKDRRIVDAEKFMPWPPPSGYTVNAMSWSPDGHRLALDVTLQQPPSGYEVATGKNKGKDEDTEDRSPVSTVGGGRVVTLLEENGAEIKVAGSKSRFIEDAKNSAWLSDGQTVVYQPSGSNQINRVKPSEGKTETLFGGQSFQAIVWDAAHDRAFAVGSGVRGQTTLLQLDLMHERITELRRIPDFQGELTLSSSGKKIGYFEDGDTIDAIDLANPARVARVQVGYGRFEWSADDRRILLKRGPEEKSNYLVWVTLADGSFESCLHDLIFSQFHLTSDGRSIVVTEPGKRVLKIYPIQ